MNRRKAREYALQILFQVDFTGRHPDREFVERFISEKDSRPETRKFVEELVRGVLGHLAEIDRRVQEVAEHWKVERMAAVDRTILRIAAYEILYRMDIPPAVTINEAIEIAKKFSSHESSPFINGILDRIAHEAGKS